MEVLARNEQYFPNDVAIIVAEAEHVEEAVTIMVPIISRILALSFMLLITAWTVTLIRVLSLDNPGLMVHSLIVLVVAMTLVIPHYRLGAEALGRFMR